jgi:hypothetical protein
MISFSGRLMHTDIPTHADVDHLLSVRDAACVSIYLPTELRHPV